MAAARGLAVMPRRRCDRRFGGHGITTDTALSSMLPALSMGVIQRAYGMHRAVRATAEPVPAPEQSNYWYYCAAAGLLSLRE